VLPIGRGEAPTRGIPDRWEQMDDSGLMSLMTAAALVTASTNKLPQS
jgi:hypothetical protein